MWSKDLENDFKYHAPKGEDDVNKYTTIRATAKTMTKLIIDMAPDCKERDEAIKNIQMSVMWTNAAIARDCEYEKCYLKGVEENGMHKIIEMTESEAIDDLQKENNELKEELDFYKRIEKDNKIVENIIEQCRKKSAMTDEDMRAIAKALNEGLNKK